MKKVILLSALSLAVLLLSGSGKCGGNKKSTGSNLSKDTIKEQADSLLKAGNEEAALELYFLDVNLLEPYSSLQFPLFKIIGEVYLKKQEYQKAIYFFRQYEWMATQQIEYSKGHMPTAGAEWWAQTDSSRLVLEKELQGFSQLLKKLEKEHLK